MKHVLFPLVLSCAGLLAAPAANAQGFPDRPVRLISPFPAAGPLDVMARLYAQRLSERWGKPVVVETRAGATGTIGTDLVAKAAPDGHTLLMTVDLPIAMAPALFKPPYDVKTDLLPIAGVAEGMNLLMIHPSTGANTLAEFVAAARARPGAFTFSSGGNGSPGHLCGEMLKTAAGINLVHVPYKGAAPATQAIVAGEVSMFCGPIPQALPHLKSGKLRGIGVTGTNTSHLVPDQRPLSETYPGVTISSWYAFFAPPRTPPHIAAAVRAEVRRVWDEPEVRQRLNGMGIDPLWMEPAELSAVIDRDLAKWTRVVREANVKVE